MRQARGRAASGWAPGAAPDSPSLTFDWTGLEATAECIRSGNVLWPATFGLPVVLVSSEKSESEIPESRQPIYDFLLTSGRVRVEVIMAGSRAAVFLRERQAQFGDALVILGGGTGVEHSADLYLTRRRSVVPLDLALGASREDGTGGALRLAKQARAEPNRFLRFSAIDAGTEGAALASIATRDGHAPSRGIAGRVSGILATVARPDAFYVRLLRTDHAKFGKRGTARVFPFPYIGAILRTRLPSVRTLESALDLEREASMWRIGAPKNECGSRAAHRPRSRFS